MGYTDPKGHTTDDVIQVRRAKVMELRVERGWSTRRIAKELGVSHHTVSRDMHAAVQEECEGLPDLVKTHREVECQKMDALWAKAYAALELATDPDDIAKLSNTLKGISERRGKLMGLDAPIKQEIDATIGSAPRTADAAREMMNAYFKNEGGGSAADDDDGDDE